MKELLVIDDDDVDVMVIRRMVARKNPTWVIRRAKDGVEGLELLRDDSDRNDSDGNNSSGALARLVLLDLNMPKMNGIEFLQALRGDPRLRQTPVIVLSTSESVDDRQAAYALSARAYIVKAELVHHPDILTSTIEMAFRALGISNDGFEKKEQSLQ